VKQILRSGSETVPKLSRPDCLSTHLDVVRALFASCEGNVVRVQEELLKKDIEIPYSTLTAACRRYGLGVEGALTKRPHGHYTFLPGEEMQHDTSPHRVKIAGVYRMLQCASLWLGYSTMSYAQCYPRFNRLYCKTFLTESVQFFEGACEQCTVDNTHLVVLRGTGPDAVIVPEMVAFAKRFGFKFVPHLKGDANRSGGVERRFHYIENNFYKGRTFSSLQDLNQQFRVWCDEKNRTFRKHLQVKPIELFRLERTQLKPLPPHIPEVYQLHSRIVDLTGYVHVHTNAYSMPCEFIGKTVEIRESIDAIRIYYKHQQIAVHERQEEGLYRRSTLPEHRCSEQWKRFTRHPPAIPEENALRAGGEELRLMLDAIKKKHSGRGVRAIRQLHRMFLDYPEEPLREALRSALAFGLTDLGRLEQMVLKQIAGDFFRLPLKQENDDE
jgi:hypothetical protein